jgi:hypothetical protein
MCATEEGEVREWSLQGDMQEGACKMARHRKQRVDGWLGGRRRGSGTHTLDDTHFFARGAQATCPFCLASAALLKTHWWPMLAALVVLDLGQTRNAIDWPTGR